MLYMLTHLSANPSKARTAPVDGMINYVISKNSAKVRPFNSKMPQFHHFTISIVYLRSLMVKIVPFILCLLVFSQCTSRVHSFEDLPKEYIEMGSFGGFAGVTIRYYFLPSGQRFVYQGDLSTMTNTEEIEKITPKEYKNLQQSLKDIDFKNIELNETGNMTYFIRCKTPRDENLVQWSNMDTAPEAVVELYRSSLKNINTAPIN